MKTMPGRRILFLCTGNSCRSRVAEGWFRHYAGTRAEACSAGIEPAGRNPTAVTVMSEAGIDISAQRSKHLDDFAGQDLLFVIRCVTQPTRHAREHSNRCIGAFTIPRIGGEQQRLAVFRRARDEIRDQVREFAISNDSWHTNSTRSLPAAFFTSVGSHAAGPAILLPSLYFPFRSARKHAWLRPVFGGSRRAGPIQAATSPC